MNDSLSIKRNDYLWGLLLGFPALLGYLFLASKFSPGLAMLVILGLAFVLVSLVHPVVPLMLCFFVIFSGIVWGLGIANGFLPLAIFSIAAWIARKVYTMDTYLVSDRQLLYIIMYLAFVVASVYGAVESKMYTFKYIFNYVKLFAFYILVSNVIETKKHVRWAVAVIVIATSISVFYGFYKVLFALNSPQELVLNARLRGLTDDPNAIALHIIFITPILLMLIFHKGRHWSSAILLGLAFTLAAGLVATFSRGGAVAFVVVVLIVLYLNRSWEMAASLLLVTVFLVIFIVPPDFWKHLGTLFDVGKFLQDDSLRERFLLLSGALDEFYRHPLLGIGIGNFVLISRKYVLEHLAVHNIILQVAVETGFLGMLFFMFAFFRTFTNFNFARSRFNAAGDTVMSVVAHGMLIGFIGIFVACLFLSNQEAFVLWTLFGLSVAVRKVAEKEDADQVTT